MDERIKTYARYEALRNERGLNDYRVSAGSGVARSRLSEWKNKKCTLSALNFVKLARFMGVPVEYFFDWL